MIISSGPQASQIIEVLKTFGSLAENARILVFTMSLKMNMPLLEQEPNLVISVVSTIVELQAKINLVLKMFKTDFDPNEQFADNENLKNDQTLL